MITNESMRDNMSARRNVKRLIFTISQDTRI